MTGSELIAEKVRTNREHKGYTAEHDDVHDEGELCAASVCYLDRAWLQIQQKSPRQESPPYIWPFEQNAWNPSDDPVRNLVHAGALIAAEIDRLKRKRGDDK
jgi:hypothetical protein